MFDFHLFLFIDLSFYLRIHLYLNLLSESLPLIRMCIPKDRQQLRIYILQRKREREPFFLGGGGRMKVPMILYHYYYLFSPVYHLTITCDSMEGLRGRPQLELMIHQRKSLHENMAVMLVRKISNQYIIRVYIYFFFLPPQLFLQACSLAGLLTRLA